MRSNARCCRAAVLQCQLAYRALFEALFTRLRSVARRLQKVQASGEAQANPAKQELLLSIEAALLEVML